MRGALLLSLQSLRSSTRSHYCDRQRHLVTQRRRRCLFHAEPAAAPTSRPPPSAAASVSSSDVVLRYLSVNGEIAVLVADATRLVVHAAALHCTSPTATAALGRALVGALLLSGFKEAGESVQLSFTGDGPLGRLLAIARDGSAKGCVYNAQAELPLRPDGKFDVGGVVGSVGTLSVVRSDPRLREPYTGIVPLASGEVAEDIASYLASSEQVASAIALGVLIGKGGVEAAGGYFIQLLPGASDETITGLEATLAALPSVTALLASGAGASGIAARLLENVGGARPGGGEGSNCVVPSYGPCEEADIRARMARACAALGATELRRIVSEEGKLEVTDDLCGCTLLLDAEAIIAAAEAPPP